MHYAISDIHGCAQALDVLLEHVKFDPKSDKLYLLGDYVDGGYVKNASEIACADFLPIAGETSYYKSNGVQSIYTLYKIMCLTDFPNVTALLGNHDYMALRAFTDSLFMDTIPEDYTASSFSYRNNNWLRNNDGQYAMAAFSAQSALLKRDIISWLQNRPLQATVKIGNTSFVLCHTVADFMVAHGRDNSIQFTDVERQVWLRPSGQRNSFDNFYGYVPSDTRVVFGHTQVYYIDEFNTKSGIGTYDLGKKQVAAWTSVIDHVNRRLSGESKPIPKNRKAYLVTEEERKLNGWEFPRVPKMPGFEELDTDEIIALSKADELLHWLKSEKRKASKLNAGFIGIDCGAKAFCGSGYGNKTVGDSKHKLALYCLETGKAEYISGAEMTVKRWAKGTPYIDRLLRFDSTRIYSETPNVTGGFKGLVSDDEAFDDDAFSISLELIQDISPDSANDDFLVDLFDDAGDISVKSGDGAAAVPGAYSADDARDIFNNMGGVRVVLGNESYADSTDDDAIRRTFLAMGFA
jgi:hypothetical protein